MTLLDYLKSKEIRVVTFAEQVGVSRQRIYELMRGASCGPKLALTIEKATGNNVTIRELLFPETQNETLRPSA